MQDDIYSLGVCLFEIGLWRSMFKWDRSIPDYTIDESFLDLSDKAGERKLMGSEERASDKIRVLIEATERMIPRTMGDAFANVVVACLKAGLPDSPFAAEISSAANHAYDTDTNREEEQPASLTYLELVLSKLHTIHDALTVRR